MKWYRRAADKGFGGAQNNLGVMYAQGLGVPQNYAEAVKWYRRAADLDHAEAQSNLGNMYENGFGVAQDYAEALKLYRLAAEQNYPPAETLLGGMYQKGSGVQRDLVEAVRLYRRAADQGDSFAQNNLGVMYATGQAVPQDYVQAYMWFSISLAHGNGTSANNRERAAALMTPAQIAEAEKLAQECKSARVEAQLRAALDRDPSRSKRPGERFWTTLTGMQFGIFGSAQANSGDLPPESGQGFRDYLDTAVEAEALGYRSSFLVEHHFTGWNQVSATLMLQTALAMRTTTLRLGSAVIVLPWHNPVLLAEQAATLDLISGGRLDFGIGKGYRYNEFAGFRIPPEEAEARFDESVAVMTKSFVSRERFSHRGKFWQFDDIVVEPPPAQRPHPPFWVAAGSDASIRRAAQRGFNLILDQYASPEVLGRRIALYRAERTAACLRAPAQIAVARQAYVANDRADAEAALEKQAAWTRRTVAVSQAPGSKTGSHVLAYAATPQGTEANALYGTPEEISRGLEALQNAGVDYVILTLLGGKEQLRRFAREVMPAFPVR